MRIDLVILFGLFYILNTEISAIGGVWDLGLGGFFLLLNICDHRK